MNIYNMGCALRFKTDRKNDVVWFESVYRKAPKDMEHSTHVC